MTLVAPQGTHEVIAPETRRVAGLLAREKTGAILAHLHRNPYRSASEIARLEDIHVATAQRYLKDLVDAGLLAVRLRESSARPTEEYWLLEPRITIEIDLERDPTRGPLALAETAHRLGVRDGGRPDLVFDLNPRTGEVEQLLVLSDDERRHVEKRVRLGTALGRFIAHVPAAGTAPASVWNVVRSAGLGEEHLPEILGAVHRFAISQRPPGKGPTGSARPIDPETQRIFADITHDAHRLVAPPPSVPFLELVPIDEEAAA